MNNFRKLNVWQKAVALSTVIYNQTKSFPRDERFGLVSQMRRSVVSVSSNIAEGAGRESKKEFKHFLNIAIGSCYELETQLIISTNLDYVNQSEFGNINDSVIEVEKMLYALIQSLK